MIYFHSRYKMGFKGIIWLKIDFFTYVHFEIIKPYVTQIATKIKNKYVFLHAFSSINFYF